MVGDPVGDPAHAVLADAEAEVAAGLGRAEVAAALDVGQVALREVGGAAEELRDAGGEGVDRVGLRVAGRHLGARLPAREGGVPAGREVAVEAPLEGGGLGREGGPVALERGVPAVDQVLAEQDRPREDRRHGDRERGSVASGSQP